MILVLNGSPNKNSQTLKITKRLFDKKTELIKIVNLYSHKFDSCDDCGYCNSKIGCIKKDDMDNIYDLLEKSTTLVISSPIYFGCLSDITMRAINRFQRYYNQKFSLMDNNIPPVENLILVSTQGGEDKKMFGGAKETMRILCKLFEPKKYLEILVPNADKIDPLTVRNTHSQIKRTIKQLKR